MQTPPQQLEQEVRFDARHAAAVPLETALPGQVLMIGMRTGQHLRDHRVATPITIQVVRGEGTLIAAGAPYPVHAGAFISLAADVMHGATGRRTSSCSSIARRPPRRKRSNRKHPRTLRQLTR